jgi:hypothetical protein
MMMMIIPGYENKINKWNERLLLELLLLFSVSYLASSKR